jgi:hypothetical protein
MQERVFNLFVFVTRDHVCELGAVAHDIDGADSDKLAYLRCAAVNDLSAAHRSTVPQRYLVREKDGTFAPGMHYRVFQQMTDGGRLCEIFHEVLEEFGAGASPIVCVTPVVDGTVRIDRVGNLPEAPVQLRKTVVQRFPLPDYAGVYWTDKGFDLCRLLNDDYFRAVKLLYRKHFFVSAAKLLMSFIDTVAYLDEGDSAGSFQRWLNSFVALPTLGVTADELWEFRNSLLHMTNIDSRKVIAGKVHRLLFFVGTMPCGFALQNDETKYFNLHDLIHALIDGLAKWVDEFNQEPSKTAVLFERYDRILSDVRYEVVSHSAGHPN